MAMRYDTDIFPFLKDLTPQKLVEMGYYTPEDVTAGYDPYSDNIGVRNVIGRIVLDKRHSATDADKARVYQGLERLGAEQDALMKKGRLTAKSGFNRGALTPEEEARYNWLADNQALANSYLYGKGDTAGDSLKALAKFVAMAAGGYGALSSLAAPAVAGSTGMGTALGGAGADTLGTAATTASSGASAGGGLGGALTSAGNFLTSINPINIVADALPTGLGGVVKTVGNLPFTAISKLGGAITGPSSDVVSGGEGLSVLDNTSRAGGNILDGTALDGTWLDDILEFTKDNSGLIGAGLTGLGIYSDYEAGKEATKEQKQSQAAAKAKNEKMTEDIRSALATAPLERNYTPRGRDSYYSYGLVPRASYFTEVLPQRNYARGGEVKTEFADGGLAGVQIPFADNQRLKRAVGFTGSFDDAKYWWDWARQNPGAYWQYEVMAKEQFPTQFKPNMDWDLNTEGTQLFTDLYGPMAGVKLPQKINQQLKREVGFTGSFDDVNTWMDWARNNPSAYAQYDTKARAYSPVYTPNVDFDLNTPGLQTYEQIQRPVTPAQPTTSRRFNPMGGNPELYGLTPEKIYFEYLNANNAGTNPTPQPSMGGLRYEPEDESERTARLYGFTGQFGNNELTDWRRNQGITDQEFNIYGGNYTGNSGVTDKPELNPEYDYFRGAKKLGYSGAKNMDAMRDWRRTNSIKDFELEGAGVPTQFRARGGRIPGEAKSGPGVNRYIDGPGGGQDDVIDAKLSAGEFVIPADVVAGLGDGSNEEGAKRLYSFMENVRKHKATKNHPPKAKPVEKYITGKKK